LSKVARQDEYVSTEADMAAGVVYRFDYIAPNSGDNVFIHGYLDNQAVAYSAVVYAGAGVNNPIGACSITQGETYRHVDGTIGRKVYVQNLAPFNSCTVDILQTVETFWPSDLGGFVMAKVNIHVWYNINGEIVAVGRPMGGAKCVAMSRENQSVLETEVDEKHVADLYKTHIVDVGRKAVVALSDYKK
jgi:hypothetical protein